MSLPAAMLVILLPNDGLGKAMEDDPSNWAPA